MGTRIFCDHCGNTVTQVNRYGFGPMPQYIPDYSNQQTIQRIQAQQSLIGIQYQALAPQTPIKDVDLCNTCVPIWMKRVEALCKNSDV